MARTDETSTDWLQPPAAQQGLKRYIDTIRERIWLVIGAVVLTTGAAVAYVTTADKVYEAEADILVSPVADESGLLATLGLISESNDPLRAVETAATLVESNAAAGETASALGSDAKPQSILADVEVQPVAESNIVTVTAQGPSEDAAVELANLFARTAIAIRTDLLHDRINEELPRLRDRVDELPPGTTLDTLTSQIAQLEILRAGSDPTLEVAETAIDARQVAPRRLASVVAGLLAGLVLGIGGAFALQVLDPRLRREDQLRNRFRLPILTRVPRERSRGSEPLAWERLSGGAIEAYRTLRAILARPLAHTDRAGSILVTSPGPSEGKTTTAINLATSLALTGKRVILIEADLRRPTMGKSLGVEPERGVISVLIEEATVEDCLVHPDSGNPNLRVLLAEQAGVWGGELLSLPAGERLVDEAKLLSDYVVVDSPPLATVVDALPLARNVEDVVLVVRLGSSRLNRIQELAELLADAGIKPAGFAVIGVPREREEYYGDGARRRRLIGRDRLEPTLASRDS